MDDMPLFHRIIPDKTLAQAEAHDSMDDHRRDEQRYHDICQKMQGYSRAYYQDSDPLISDSDYDALFQEIAMLERKYPALISPDSPTQSVGYQVKEEGVKIIHQHPMLSLDNAFSDEDMAQWLDRISRLLSGEEYRIFASLKIDGLSLSLIYEHGILRRAVTRGDGHMGEDVTCNIDMIEGIPQSLPSQKTVEIRGEVYMRKDDFQALNNHRSEKGKKLFINPRNAAAGSLRQQHRDSEEKRQLHFFAYQLLQDESISCVSKSYAWMTEQGFDVTEMGEVLCDGVSDVTAYYRRLVDMRDGLQYEIDGLVYKVDAIDQQQALGTVGRFPRWSMARKFPAAQEITTLLDITVQVGRSGILTPVAQVEPVLIGGVTVQRVTLHNFDEIARLNIHIGDQVVVKRSGDVIPKITEVVTKGDHKGYYLAVVECPSCASPVARLNHEEEGGLYCCNIGCSEREIQYLCYFASRAVVDIDGMSEATIREFYHQGWLRHCADIYTLDQKASEILALEGWGATSLRKLIDAIKIRRSMSLEKFIESMAIDGIGKVIAQQLARVYGDCHRLYDSLCHNKKDRNIMLLQAIDGIDRKGAENLIAWFQEEYYQQRWQALLDHVTIKPVIGQATMTVPVMVSHMAKMIENLGQRSVEHMLQYEEDWWNFLHSERASEDVIKLCSVMYEDPLVPSPKVALLEAFLSSKQAEIFWQDYTNLWHLIASGQQESDQKPALTVLFTGVLQHMTRTEAMARAKDKGYHPVTSLSSNTDMLVIGSKAGSKLKKAQKLGIRIVTEEGFLDMLA